MFSRHRGSGQGCREMDSELRCEHVAGARLRGAIFSSAFLTQSEMLLVADGHALPCGKASRTPAVLCLTAAPGSYCLFHCSRGLSSGIHWPIGPYP